MRSQEVLFLVIGVVIVFVVGRLISNNGRTFLAKSAPSEDGSAGSAATLVAVFFHLLTLGLVALIAEMPAGSNPDRSLLIRVGVLLVVLALIYGITLSQLSRRRTEAMITEIETHGAHGEGPIVGIRVQPRDEYQDQGDHSL
jgi:protein-S-isoprenylcysteine O-methyltransferase Ste14